jgi:hypothetical protein
VRDKPLNQAFLSTQYFKRLPLGRFPRTECANGFLAAFAALRLIYNSSIIARYMWLEVAPAKVPDRDRYNRVGSLGGLKRRGFIASFLLVGAVSICFMNSYRSRSLAVKRVFSQNCVVIAGGRGRVDSVVAFNCWHR